MRIHLKALEVWKWADSDNGCRTCDGPAEVEVSDAGRNVEVRVVIEALSSI